MLAAAEGAVAELALVLFLGRARLAGGRRRWVRRHFSRQALRRRGGGRGGGGKRARDWVHSAKGACDDGLEALVEEGVAGGAGWAAVQGWMAMAMAMAMAMGWADGMDGKRERSLEAVELPTRAGIGREGRQVRKRGRARMPLARSLFPSPCGLLDDTPSSILSPSAVLHGLHLRHGTAVTKEGLYSLACRSLYLHVSVLVFSCLFASSSYRSQSSESSGKSLTPPLAAACRAPFPACIMACIPSLTASLGTLADVEGPASWPCRQYLPMYMPWKPPPLPASYLPRSILQDPPRSSKTHASSHWLLGTLSILSGHDSRSPDPLSHLASSTAASAIYRTIVLWYPVGIYPSVHLPTCLRYFFSSPSFLHCIRAAPR